MTARALIVSIQNYPNSQGMANELPGTNQAADDFWKWFSEKKIKSSNPEIDPKAFVIGCVDHPYEWRTSGTTRNDIVKELAKLVDTGRDNTSELYVFWSGHGFSYTDMGWTRAIDVLVASDFVNQAMSGGACIKLQEVQEKLWSAMGPGDHYYFIDACRNTTTHNKINVLDTGLTFTPSELGKPFLYTLYSTVKGTAAEVESGFGPALVSGLRGSGRAKGWEEDNSKMFVKFDLLVDFVEKKLAAQTVDPKIDGNGKGLILELIPTPESDCIIKVDNATPSDEFKVVAKTRFGKEGPFEFKGQSYNMKLPPFLYNVEVTHTAAHVIRVSPPPPAPLDLYDPCEAHFAKSQVTVAVPVQDSTLEVSAPPSRHSEVEIENLSLGTTLRSTKSASEPSARGGGDVGGKLFEPTGEGSTLRGTVEPGTYMVRLRERGVVTKRKKVTVGAGENVNVDLTEHAENKVRDDILKVLLTGPKGQSSGLSQEYPGATASPDLSPWLSILGATRIVGSELKKQFPAVEKLALESFEDIGPGQSCAYVLGAFEKSEGEFRVALSQDPAVAWTSLKPVPELTSVYQWRQQTGPGPYLLSIGFPDQVPLTFATYCLPNRTTFMVLAEDEVGRLMVRQYMLPVEKLIDNLEPEVKGRIKYNPFGLIRYMSLVQSQFARKRSLEPEENSSEAVTWEEIVYGKWIDPVMSLLAAYFFIREGRSGPEADPNDKQLLETVVVNLRKYFGDLPDVNALEKLLKKDSSPPLATPIVLDGVLAFGSDSEKVMPFSPSNLDFSGPWTCWRGAVNAFSD